VVDDIVVVIVNCVDKTDVLKKVFPTLSTAKFRTRSEYRSQCQQSFGLRIVLIRGCLILSSI